MSNPECPQKEPYTVELEAGEYWWCACGLSKTQPTCDGSHKYTDFTPVSFTLDKKLTVFLCGCKQTKNPPYCDGSHSSL